LCFDFFYPLIQPPSSSSITTKLLGAEITVEKIDITDEEEIVAISRRGRDRQRISILELPLPIPRPVGAEWIEAYRRWARWR
jgi:hypothetical protein